MVIPDYPCARNTNKHHWTWKLCSNLGTYMTFSSNACNLISLLLNTSMKVT